MRPPIIKSRWLRRSVLRHSYWLRRTRERFAETAWRLPMTAHAGAEPADPPGFDPGATDGEFGPATLGIAQQYNGNRGGYDPMRHAAHAAVQDAASV
jgi:hypothetical protein